MTIEIQKATSHDLEVLAMHHQRAWRAACENWYPPALMHEVDHGTFIEIWHEVFARDSHVFAAMDGAQMVGHIDVAQCESEPSAAELSRLYLDPAYLRRGIGTRLLQTACDDALCSGFEHARLWLVVGNQDAEAFYVALGWTRTNETQVLEGNGWSLDEVLFRKDLRQNATGID